MLSLSKVSFRVFDQLKNKIQNLQFSLFFVFYFHEEIEKQIN